jgi:hypothetical protein
MYGESQFDSHLSKLLQLVNAWLVELWDDWAQLLEKTWWQAAVITKSVIWAA